MLLNGEPLISFVLTTVYTSTYLSGSVGSMQSEKFSLGR
jgi:hypothetical protein